MTKVTLEQTHALLVKLTEFVINEFPKINATTDRIEPRLNQQIEYKQVLKRLEDNLELLLEKMASRGEQLNSLLIEMKTITKALKIFDERIGNLEERTFGYRVRDIEE